MSAVPELDRSAAAAARARWSAAGQPPGAFGRLEQLASWLAGAQGTSAPHPPRRPVLVVVAGDHGVARGGVSNHPPGAAAEAVRAIEAGESLTSLLAARAGARVRVVDAGLEADSPGQVGAWKVSRGSGPVDRQDALGSDQVDRALAVGRLIADSEADAGTDLLLAGDLGRGTTVPAATVIGLLTGADPAQVSGRPGTGDGSRWVRRTTAIRDAMHRGSAYRQDPAALLQVVGGADLAVLTGMLAQAAARRTPTLLDGLVPAACALLAGRLAPGSAAWWVAASGSADPAHRLALDSLGLEPVLDLDIRTGAGTGALLALPVLAAAAELLGSFPC